MSGDNGVSMFDLLGFSVIIGGNSKHPPGPVMSSVVTRIESDRPSAAPPHEWNARVRAGHQVEMVRCEAGILVKPLPMTPWQLLNGAKSS